jgi:hypothetical protein
MPNIFSLLPIGGPFSNPSSWLALTQHLPWMADQPFIYLLLIGLFCAVLPATSKLPRFLSLLLISKLASYTAHGQGNSPCVHTVLAILSLLLMGCASPALHWWMSFYPPWRVRPRGFSTRSSPSDSASRTWAHSTRGTGSGKETRVRYNTVHSIRLCFQNMGTQYTRNRLWKEDKSKVQNIKLYFPNIRPTVHTEPAL